MSRSRSPDYPAISLTESIKLAHAIWDKEKRTAVTAEVAAKDMGYTSLSGPVRTKLAALKKFGLIDGDFKSLKLSELAIEILHSQLNSPGQIKAIQKAALTPTLFQELAKGHLDASDEALKSYLIVNNKFTEVGARHLTRAFKDTVTIANLKDSVYDDMNKNTDVEAMPSALGTDPITTLSNPFQASGEGRGTAGKPNVKILVFGLTKDVTAEVRLTGEKIKASHLEGLKQHIELTKKLWESDEEDQ